MKLLRGRQQRERGTVAIIAAIVIVVMIGFAAFVVDVGYIFRVRGELQNASDAAALAGAMELDGTTTGIDNARNRVLEYADLHFADNTEVTIQPDDIDFGHWHYDDASQCTDGKTATPCFESLGTNPASDMAIAVNAVQVISRRTQATGDQLHLYFAGFVGRPETDVVALATAIGGGPFKECGFPMVVPDCALEDVLQEGDPENEEDPDLCQWCMQFQNANSDTAGWTGFGENGFPIEDLIEQICGSEAEGFHVDETTGECNGTCRSWSMADGDLDVFNGNSMNKNNYCGLIQEILLRDGSGKAKQFVVRVPVLQSDDTTTCDASQFSGHKPLAGWATVNIFGAKCGTASDEVMVIPNPYSECTPPPSDKWILASLECALDSDDPPGGGFFGTESRRSRLVR